MSKIEWTDVTWNPVAGCTKCSPGCKNCYAEKMAIRLACMNIKKYQQDTVTADGWTGNIYCDVSAPDQPLHWRKPRKIFVCSMSDLFHPKVPFDFINEVFYTIMLSTRHTYQLLTKRIDRAYEYMKNIENPFFNLHLGVSVSTQAEADEKIPILLQIPAAVRFVSIEPMLERINGLHIGKCGYYCDEEVGHVDHTYLDWVIVGAESKGRAAGRPCKLDWIDLIVSQCKSANIPIFVKQIHRDGKLVKMPTEYPQEYPNG